MFFFFKQETGLEMEFRYLSSDVCPSDLNTEFKAACESLTIEPEIVPFMIEDEKPKVDLLLAANGQKAIASRKTTAQILGWVNDEEAEIAQIEEEENAASYSDILEPSI